MAPPRGARHSRPGRGRAGPQKNNMQDDQPVSWIYWSTLPPPVSCLGVISGLRPDGSGALRRCYNPIPTPSGCYFPPILKRLQACIPSFFRLKLRGEKIIRRPQAVVLQPHTLSGGRETSPTNQEPGRSAFGRKSINAEPQP